MKTRIELMFEMQKEYDQMVFKAHGLKGYKDIDFDRLGLALVDEIGELVHELKGNWCWWKNTQKPVDEEKALEEFVDVIHFLLMHSIRKGCQWVTHGISTWNLTWQRNDEVCLENNDPNALSTYCAFIMATEVPKVYSREQYAWAVKFAQSMGWTEDQVFEAYKRKNEINRRRVEEGY